MATPAVTASVKLTKKKTASSKPKKVADHPKYAEMIKDALTNLKERGGSSRMAILKYIMKKYQLGQDEKLINAHLKMALRSGIKSGSLKQSKGTGAAGSFRIGAEKQTKPGKKPKAAGAKKPKVAKKSKSSRSPTKTKKPMKVAAGEGKVKKPKVAKKPKVVKKPKSPTKTAKPTATKKPTAVKAAKPKAQKPKVVKSKKVAAK